MQYFGEPEGRVKIQMMTFPQNSDLPRFFIFRTVGGMRRVQISCNICTRFARYLYSTKQSWIIIGDILNVKRTD